VNVRYPIQGVVVRLRGAAGRSRGESPAGCGAEPASAFGAIGAGLAGKWLWASAFCQSPYYGHIKVVAARARDQ